MQENLTGWHPILDICSALETSYHTIRPIVKRAGRNHENWVKKEGGRWFVDTDHPLYDQRIVKAVKRQPTLFSLHTNDFDEEFPDTFSYSDPATEPFFPLAPAAPDVLHSWPDFRSWLKEQGVSIFANALSDLDQDPWQWQWGSVSGNGCRSIEDALLNALKGKHASMEHRIASLEQQVTSLKREVALSEVEPVRRKWF